MQYHLACATLVLNAKKISTYVEHKQNNIGAFSTHVEWSETQFFFCSSYMPAYFILKSGDVAEN